MTRRRVVVLATAALTVAGLVAGCGGGSVSVLNAGSLVSLIDTTVGGAFQKSSGVKFSGFGMDSQSVANAIKAKTKSGDVFISASPTVNASLEGSANGDWVSWYAAFATAPVVIGYNPKSRFAKDFRTMPWYKVLAMPGIKLGRTDPVLDPKGVLTVAALKAAVSTYHLSASFPATVEKAAQVFPEPELQGRLQTGQIDAGFFYTNESVPLHLTTVTLGKVHEAATFTVTVLNKAKSPAAGAAFVKYLLTTAEPTLNANGLRTITPTVSGSTSAVPASLRAVLGM
jgi:molybdate/tungstate transport system substrate-binding protein